MASSRDGVFGAALDLDADDRERLAELLFDSLPDAEGVEEALAIEAHRRRLELEQGAVEGIPAEGVIQQLRDRRARTREDEILPEYSLKGAVRGKYADRYARDTTVVLLDPDVAEVFPDAESVNRALRALAQIIREQAAKTAA